MINICDLGDFSIEPTLPLIETFRPEVTPAEFGRIIKEMQRVVTEFETNNTPDSARYDKTTKFLEKHESDLAKLSEVGVGSVEANLELGELLLRGGHYEKATELYKKCLAITGRDGWVLLRLAETYDRMGRTYTALDYVKSQHCMTFLYMSQRNIVTLSYPSLPLFGGGSNFSTVFRTRG
jgi:tetratricopeptide (TPR) repeat protein